MFWFVKVNQLIGHNPDYLGLKITGTVSSIYLFAVYSPLAYGFCLDVRYEVREADCGEYHEAMKKHNNRTTGKQAVCLASPRKLEDLSIFFQLAQGSPFKREERFWSPFLSVLILVTK